MPGNRSTLAVTMALVAYLPACATPIGQLRDSDFVWSTQSMKGNYQEVYRKVWEGFRRCNRFVADGNLYTDLQEGRFDIYLRDLLGGRSAWVFGVITVQGNGDGVSMSVGVNQKFDKRLFEQRGVYREIFMDWADGNYRCG